MFGLFDAVLLVVFVVLSVVAIVRLVRAREWGLLVLSLLIPVMLPFTLIVIDGEV